jgi:hypothetical protein
MHRVVVRRLAGGDIADAHCWYDEQRAGLGREFLDEIEATLKRIADGPLRFPVAIGDVRRALVVRRFPYSVYFRNRPLNHGLGHCCSCGFPEKGCSAWLGVQTGSLTTSFIAPRIVSQAVPHSDG